MGITLLDMLLNAGIINRDQFEEALKNRVLYGGKIGTSLIELGYVKEDDLARFLGKKLAVPYVGAERLLNIPSETIALIPKELALRYGVIPIHRDKKRLYMVMSDPADLKAIDDISFMTGYIINPVAAPEVRLVQALGKYYNYEVDQRYQHILQRIEQEKSAEKPQSKPLAEPAAAPAMEHKPVAPPEPAAKTALSLTGEEHLEEVEIVDSEELVRRVGHYSIDLVSQTLAKVDDREEIADILVGYLSQEFRRVALFVIRGDAAFGWRGVHRGQEIHDFGKLVVPFMGQSVLKTVTDGMAYYLGSIPETAENMIMINGMGGDRPAAALMLPLIVSGRVVMVLYVDGGETDLGEKFVELHRLLAKAVLAFEILIFREKILML
ncbi:general secretion pathway protein GspE [Geotalea sp. SG265]|uniref:GspE/PulE/PilB domain-containing protein n=1 Tax=Geotalea sp. SG265 TaxID=2922867 RepID=UPI001FAFE819|nr:general secretion pathway protein GspE [Geotalea sp. SG265]